MTTAGGSDSPYFSVLAMDIVKFGVGELSDHLLDVLISDVITRNLEIQGINGETLLTLNNLELIDVAIRSLIIRLFYVYCVLMMAEAGPPAKKRNLTLRTILSSQNFKVLCAYYKRWIATL
jgi:hypothetical protein